MSVIGVDRGYVSDRGRGKCILVIRVEGHSMSVIGVEGKVCQ